MSEAKATTTAKYASLGLSVVVVVVGAVMWLTTVQNDGKHNTQAVEELRMDMKSVLDDTTEIKIELAGVKKLIERNQTLTRNP